MAQKLFFSHTVLISLNGSLTMDVTTIASDTAGYPVNRKYDYLASCN